MKKIHKVLLISATVMLALIFGYITRAHYYQTRFLPNTKINQVDVSGQTLSSAKASLTADDKKANYTLLDQKKTVTKFNLQQIGATYDQDKLVSQIKAKQNPYTWIFKHFTKSSQKITTTALTIDQTKFDQYLNQIIKPLNEKRKPTSNATLTAKNDQFEITPEVYGNQFDLAKVKTQITKQLNQGNNQISLSKTYVKPTIKKDNKTLVNNQKKINQIRQVKVKYNINNNLLDVPQEQIKKMVVYKDNQVSVDQTLLTDYINQLKAKYDTVSKTLSFNSTKQGTVTVPAGIYGWSIRLNTEVKSFTKNLLAGKDFTQKATVSGSGLKYSDRQIGNTYIEIDTKNQHMWYYANGQLALDTDVVTARPDKSTPSGVWYIWSKQRNATLRGTNFDGVTKYETPVSYWMPIDLQGVGIHDASWQPKFGGTWYVEHGSHGCINTPPAVMAKLYNQVAAGTPVVVI